MLINIDEKPNKWYQWILYALQHVLALFTANTLISIIVFKSYEMVPAALISAGIGTIFYLLITKFKSPIFLGSSAGLLPLMTLAFYLGCESGGNYLAIILGLIFVGIIYIIVGLIINKIGADWINKLLPPIVTGPVIMIIGLNLAKFAVQWGQSNMINNGSYNIWAIVVALFSMIITLLVAHYGQNMLKTMSYLIGIGSEYILCLILYLIGYLTNYKEICLIDFSVFNNMSWIPSFGIQKAIEHIEVFNISQIVPIIITAIPVSFITICEHIGDHLNVSSITGRNLLLNPGLGRTLIGDGVGTICGALIGGMGNTTYGENSSVISVTKVASSRVILAGAILAIILGFCSPLMTFIQTIPVCIFGGISFILYGAIAVSGFKQIQQVDLTQNKNLMIISAILITAIGGLVLDFQVFSLSSTVLAMVLGVILNLILIEKKPKQIKE